MKHSTINLLIDCLSSEDKLDLSTLFNQECSNDPNLLVL